MAELWLISLVLNKNMFVFCFLFLKNYENRQYGFETAVDLGNSQFLAQIIVILGAAPISGSKKLV